MISKHQELIDCHVRLLHAAYEGQREAVITRAQRVSVTNTVCSSVNSSEWNSLLDLVGEEPSIIPCFGLDPVHMVERPKDWQHKLQLYMSTGSAGLGLTGLDRSVRTTNIQGQVEVLRAQLDIAAQWQRPVLLRCHREWDRLIELLEGLERAPRGIMVYGFSGATGLIDRLVRVGAYFFFAGDVLSHKNGRNARTIKNVPLDRLLIGTDAPFSIPPETYAPYLLMDADRQPANEPANLPHIIAGIAPLLGQEPDGLAEILYHNSLCLFGSLIHTER